MKEHLSLSTLDVPCNCSFPYYVFSELRSRWPRNLVFSKVPSDAMSQSYQKHQGEPDDVYDAPMLALTQSSQHLIVPHSRLRGFIKFHSANIVNSEEMDSFASKKKHVVIVGAGAAGMVTIDFR